jgi:hypothetical protein
MFSHLLAAFCLLNLVISNIWADSRDPAGGELVVYLSADSGQSPHVLEYMKRELGQLMQTAGYEVAWHDVRAAQPLDTASRLIVGRLQGACAPPAGDLSAALLEKPASLASTAVADGRVLPFSSVNCGNLTRTLARCWRANRAHAAIFCTGALWLACWRTSFTTSCPEPLSMPRAAWRCPVSARATWLPSALRLRIPPW